MTISVSNTTQEPIQIEITESSDSSRVGFHQVEPADTFDILTTDVGVVRGEGLPREIPFSHGEQGVWVGGESSAISVADIEHPTVGEWPLYQRGMSVQGVHFKFGRSDGSAPGIWPHVKDTRSTRYRKKES
jgi:hypothetical protein